MKAATDKDKAEDEAAILETKYRRLPRPVVDALRRRWLKKTKRDMKPEAQSPGYKTR